MKKRILLVVLLASSYAGFACHEKVSEAELPLPLPIPLVREDAVLARLHMVLAEKAIRADKAAKRAKGSKAEGFASQAWTETIPGRFTIRNYRKPS